MRTSRLLVSASSAQSKPLGNLDVHASFLVTVPQIKVVAKTLAEVQAACTARSSDFLEVRLSSLL